MQDTVIEKAYEEMLASVARRLDGSVYDLWFKNLRLVRCFRGTLTLGVPNLFHRDCMDDNYRSTLEEVALDAFGTSLTVELVIDSELFRERRDVVRKASELAVESTRVGT